MPVHQRSRRPSTAAFAGVGLLVATGCRSYPERTQAALADFQRGHFAAAVDAYDDPDTTGSAFLAGAEAGTAALAGGDWKGAIERFGRASDVVADIERSALISPESLAETLSSWTLNDTMTTYEGEGYERVMVHAGAALAYLADGRFDDARVEVRRANALLESEEQLYEKEYAAGGLGNLVSALTYELEGDLDDAYIDYGRMLAKGVGEELAGKTLVRLARVLDRREDREGWRERFGPETERPDDAAQVVVLAGVGLAPFKEEVSITLPGPDGLIRWVVPRYVERPQPVARLVLSVEGAQESVSTVVVEDVAKVSHENLEDRIGWMAARSAARAVGKYALSKQLEDSAEGLGWIVGSLFTLTTERADLRSWQTLPATWQAARLYLPPGAHELVLSADGGGRVALGTFELEPNETMFVIARTLGTDVHAYPVGGRRVDGAPAGPPEQAEVTQ
jgi:hypothetical protein